MKNERIYIYIYICSFPAALSFPGKGIELFYVSKWLTRQGQGLDASSNFPVLKMDERSGLHAFHPEYNYSVH